MSRKLRDFIELLQTDKGTRNDLEMGTFVTWLRRRTPILRNLETNHVTEVIRNANYETFKRDDVIFRQGKPSDSQDSLHIYIILRGSASLYNNPFISQGKSSRRSSHSFERLLLSSAQEKSFLHPKSATSKSTGTRLSPILNTSLIEDADDVENGFSDENDDVITENEAECKVIQDGVKDDPKDSLKDGVDGLPDQDNDANKRPLSSGTPVSKVSKLSRMSVRSKLGNFVVKYEKGKYVSEEAILNDDDVYTGSVVVDEKTDLMVIDEETFNKYIKEHHEKEAVDLTDYVDYHPFFRDLPIQSKGIIQISLRKHRHEAGKFIIKQGEPVKSIQFIISGSAEVIIEPAKHRYQYPEFWPFETSTDLYYKEFDWLRESRRRVYQQIYHYSGEVSLRRKTKDATGRKEISVCAVMDREAIGVTEVVLNLNTYTQSYRCLHDCEVYSLSLKPFRRIYRRNGALNELVLAYIKMKLKFRVDNSLGEKVPLFNCLYNKIEKETREKSYNGMVTRSIEKIKEREADLMKALKWFKQDKAPLINNKDPGVVQLKENMKEKARIRQSVLNHENVKPYFRRGCMRAIKPRREPMSLHKLRNPMNEVLLRLRMEGTFIESEEELEEILLRYSETPVYRETDISRQLERVIDEEYNLFRYRRHGNQLVRKFSSMLDRGRIPRDRTKVSTALSFFEDDDEKDSAHSGHMEMTSDDDEFERAFSRFTKRTARSYASTYRTLQFDRRSVTPSTIEMRVRDFHQRCGGRSAEVKCLPGLARFDQENVDPEYAPLPGGKVFVTKVPCVSCNKKILLKNHSHHRCQMLHSLPMDKVHGHLNTRH